MSSFSQVFNELNNFNGMMEIVGALNSSPIHRLKLTKDVSCFRLYSCGFVFIQRPPSLSFIMQSSLLRSVHY